MPEVVGERGTPAALPAELRAAFAAEAAERLPRLLAAVEQLGRAGGAARAAVRELHPLASAAVIAGRPDTARVARECDDLLAAYAARAVPADVAARARAHVALLQRLLTSPEPGP